MVKIELPKNLISLFLIVFLIFLATPFCLGNEAMPNSSKECAICHIRWVDAFDRNTTQNLENPMQGVLERQAGSGDMCLSCHDGSVVDSRFKVWSTNHHTTNTIPPENINIPTDIFPLDAQGHMTCATCHTAHAVPDSSDLKTVIFLRQPNVDSSLCLLCHTEHAQKNDFQHPLGKVDYQIPEQIINEGGKTSDDRQTIICQTCHEPHGARNPWMLVLPPSELCIACHTEKNPQFNPEAGAPMHHIGQTFPDFKPPDTLLEEKATFGPNGELSCLSCHRLHDASGAWPLLIRNNENSSLCLDCHIKEDAVIGSLHDLRLSSPETINAKGQTASQSGPCGVCHRIHGWARNVADTNRPHSSGCMECHEPGGPGSVNRLYVDSHTVGKPIPEDMNTVLPLDKDTGSIGCLTCHDPHLPDSTETTNDLKEISLTENQQEINNFPTNNSTVQVNSEIKTPLSFLRYEGSELCEHCHKDFSDLPGRPHDSETFDSSILDTLNLNSSVGSCRVCHLIHNAQGPYLWSRKPLTEADEIIDMCGSCHNGKVGVQNSIHDPNSAQWAQDLGYKSKGVCLDCHLVHDPNGEGDIWSYIKNESDTSQSCESCHQDDAPGGLMKTEHLTKTVGSDITNLPPNMTLGSERKIICTTCHDIHQKGEDSRLLIKPLVDLCGTCHEDKIDIQNSKHDPASAEWANELNFASNGTCIDCHPIHDKNRNKSIWFAMGYNDVNQQTCENCHHQDCPGPLMDAPHIGKTLTEEQNNLPDEIKIGRDNKVVCTSCHDIHKDGKVSKQLIVLKQDSSLCIACHQDKKNIVGTQHDIRASEPNLPGTLSETVYETGGCSFCHLIHPKSDPNGLWTQKPLFQDNYGSELCTSCHGTDQDAAANLPLYVNHPEVIFLNQAIPGQTDYMPTFDKAGKYSSTGNIACLTCHEPHAEASDTIMNESSLLDRMFLRPAGGNGICVDCHGREAIWRYLFFHKERRTTYTKGKSIH